jgi:hypothetical protein
MLGSMFGVRISMWIEKRLGASADAHLKKPKVDLEKLEQRVRDLELGAPRYDD